MTVALTQEKFTLVSAEDYEFLSQWKWFYCNGYAARHTPGTNQKLILMHRVIAERMGLKINGLQVDHINQDRSDNRRENLRVATNTENMQNCIRHKDNTSGFKGVSWHTQRQKWRAYIRHNGKQVYLGSFSDKKEAVIAYNQAAIKYHGKFSCLNKV